MPTRYIDSTSFSTASAVWTDVAKTTKAADQWYSACGIARQQVGGLLGPAFVCGSLTDGCAVRCAETNINGYFGTRTTLLGGTLYSSGMYRKIITGTSGKAAFRVQISALNAAAIPSGPIGVQIQQTTALNESINPNQYPLRGISFSNLSAAFFGGGAVSGPVQERLFGAVNGCYSAPGSIAVNERLYNNSGGGFSSRVNQVVARLGTNKLFTADTGRGVFYMSPSGGQDIDLIIWNPCAQIFGSNITVDVFCSNTLREFTAYFSGAVKPPGCVIGTLPQSNVFMGNVQNALGGAIGLYDWAFSDFMASGVKADGYYYLPPQAGLPIPASNASIRVTNGIVTEFNNPCV